MEKLFKQFSFPEEFRATLLRKLPVQSMKAVNLVIHWLMHTGRSLIIRFAGGLCYGGWRG